MGVRWKSRVSFLGEASADDGAGGNCAAALKLKCDGPPHRNVQCGERPRKPQLQSQSHADLALDGVTQLQWRRLLPASAANTNR